MPRIKLFLIALSVAVVALAVTNTVSFISAANARDAKRATVQQMKIDHLAEAVEMRDTAAAEQKAAVRAAVKEERAAAKRRMARTKRAMAKHAREQAEKARQEGVSAGYSSGTSDGYASGHEEGQDEGYEEGMDDASDDLSCSDDPDVPLPYCNY